MKNPFKRLLRRGSHIRRPKREPRAPMWREDWLHRQSGPARPTVDEYRMYINMLRR